MESVGENAAIGVTANKLSPYTDGGLELTGQAA